MPRQNITILFTDMVDSTVVSMRVPPEEADELRRQHFSLLRGAVDATGGVEVKNLGDGLMVAFSSASAALSCAVRMQQVIDVDNRARPWSVGLRVGLSGGEVSFEDGDYFGDPVVEAARVCATARSGQILATEVVRLMAGRHGGHTYTSLGEMSLKGLAYEVVVLEVGWVPERGATSVELPQRIAMLPAIGFVGRVAELGLIEDRRSQVSSAGGCHVVAVMGEPGQGKTTLAAAAARHAFELGDVVLFGRADEHLSTPFRLFGEAFGYFFRHASDDQIESIIAPTAADLVRLVPDIPSRLASMPRSTAVDSDSERFLMFAAVVATLSEMSQAQPVVLVFDDVQWADVASLRLMTHIATAAAPMRVLVIATCRNDELPASHPLVETFSTLRRHDAVTRVDLDGLSRDDVERLIGELGSNVDQRTAEEILHDTDGNAFFVTELLRHFSDSGADSLRASAPRSVQEAISTRVGRLGEDDERVLRHASVIGSEFDLATLATVMSLPEAPLIDALERAVGVGLVREVSDAPGCFRFQHALTQRTIYDGLGATRRASLHRQVALALEAAPPSERHQQAAELARHWSLTGRVADLGPAVKYSRQAAEEALAGLAPDVSLALFKDAMAMRVRVVEPDAELDLDLLIGLGIAQRKTGSPEFRLTLLDASHTALAMGDTDRLLTAAINNSRGWSSAIGAIDVERVEVLERALPLLPEPDANRGLVLAALCKELSWGTTLERRQALAAEAAAIAQDCADDASAVRILNDLALPLSTPHTLETSLARTAMSLQRAERLGDPVLLFFASMWRAQALHMAGDVEGHSELIAKREELVERLGEPTLRWSKMHNNAVQSMIIGDVDGADAISAAALEFGLAHGEPDAMTYFGVQQMAICLQRGTMGELTPLIEDTLQAMPELGPAGHAALMLSHLEGGRDDLAASMLATSAASGFDYGIDNSWLVITVDHAEVAVELAMVEHAPQLSEMLEPFSSTVACTGLTSQGPVCHFLGGLAMLLGHLDEADRWFEEADAFARRAGDKFSAARTALWRGRVAARSDPELARGRFALARLIATDHGYEKVAQRAAEALAALG